MKAVTAIARKTPRMRHALALLFAFAACELPPPIPVGAPSGEDGGTLPATDGGGAASPAPARYAPGILHSPYTRAVVDRLAAVRAASPGQPDVFAKVGASNTVSTGFFHCFAGSDIRLDAWAALEPTRAFFAARTVDGTRNSFNRTSLAATVGWSAGKALEGSPNPLEQEVAAIDAGFALVMFGTNDTYPQGVMPFGRNLLGVVDELLTLGVVPILSTIPPRADSASADALVPEMNAIIRAVAQARQVPYVDLWQLLAPVPGHGLVGDGVHLSIYTNGGAHPCWFTPEAMSDGQNIRNRLHLEALDRARRFLLDGAAAEPDVAPLAGSGTFADPRVADGLPFVDAADTSTATSRAAQTYSCAPQNEGGPEIVYAVTVPRPMKLRARVFSDEGADIDLHWLDGPAPERCLARADQVLDIDVVTAGTYYLAEDSFVSAGQEKPGGYRLTLVEVP
jgi:hypothetical protein